MRQPDAPSGQQPQNFGEATGIEFDDVDPMFQDNFWHPFGAMDQIPFNFRALNSSLGNDTLGLRWFPDYANSGLGAEAAFGTQPRKLTTREAVKAAWFTRSTVEAPCDTRPMEQTHDSCKLVDEACRSDLSRSLTDREVNDELPPVNFLVSLLSEKRCKPSRS